MQPGFSQSAPIEETKSGYVREKRLQMFATSDIIRVAEAVIIIRGN
jgi:hypothetical protein